MKFTDRQILEALNHTDNENHKVLEYLYHTLLPKVQTYVTTNSGNADDAFDVFQDAMVAFCKFVKKGKFNPEYSVDGFVFSVARNIWINKIRKDKKLRHTGNELESDDNAYERTALDYIISDERKQEVKIILNKLDEKCRELLKLSIYEELTGKEICEIMGFASENGVKTQKYKCKKKLLEIIKTQKTSFFDNEI